MEISVEKSSFSSWMFVQKKSRCWMFFCWDFAGGGIFFIIGEEMRIFLERNLNFKKLPRTSRTKKKHGVCIGLHPVGPDAIEPSYK